MAAKASKNNKTKTSSKTKSNSKSKTNSKAKSSTKKKDSKKDESFIQFKNEIIILAVFAICVLALLSIIGLGGIAGDLVSSFMFGMFGYMAYILPIIIFASTVFAISNKGSRHAHIKLVAVAGLCIVLMTLLGLIINSYNKNIESLYEYYVLSSSRDHAAGLIGGIIIAFLCPFIGVAGTYVVSIITLVICAIFITEKSLLKPLGSKGKKAYETAKVKKDNYVQVRSDKKALKQQKKASRLEKKVYGVSFDTTLNEKDGWKKKSPEIKELEADNEVDNEVDTASLEDMPQIDETMDDPFKMKDFVINRGDDGSYTAEKISNEELDDDFLSTNAIEIEEVHMENYKPYEEELVKESKSNTYGGVTELFADINDPFEEEIKEEEHVSKRKSAKSAKEVEEQTKEVDAQIKASSTEKPKVYKVPPISLLKRGVKSKGDSDEHLRATAAKLEETFSNFGVGVHVTNASCGPSVTRYELQPDQGVKVSKIVGLADDIKLNLAVTDLRIEAPIPGKAAVGIEVPNEENTAVMLRELLESNEFNTSESKLSFAVGKDIAGKTVVADIAKMPHLLVAGATGSGKSVCINTLIMSILFKASPDEVKLIMVDPKVVELSVYNGIPHLLIPVVTDPKKAAGALNWAVCEMEKRYKLFAEYNVRDIKGFNKKVESLKDEEIIPEKMPQIVIIVDELADLMMVAPGEVEGSICRLAQLARAAGLHLILATQRPSVNVITGLIKANMPSRIAFSVSSGVDSRTIIDMNGAEKLLGKGDMLFYPTGYPKPARVQGSFVSDGEVQKVVDFLINNNGEVNYSSEIEDTMNSVSSGAVAISGNSSDENDAYFAEAAKLIIDKDKASIGMLQRMFKIGFNRAARIMDQLHTAGIVGPEEGTKPRKILMTMEELEEYLEENKI